MAQFALMRPGLRCRASMPPDWPDASSSVLSALGRACSSLGGIAMVGLGRPDDGPLADAVPEPAASAELVEHGPFALVRHPVYSGGPRSSSAGRSSRGPVALVLTAALALLWVGKTASEERQAADGYPGYAGLRGARPVRRLVPGVY